MTKLELSEGQPAPALGGPHQGAEHQLQDRLLAKAVRNDLQPTPLLAEETLEQVGCPGRSTVRDRQAQMRDASFEVVLEAGNSARQAAGMVGADAGGEVTSDRA